MRANVNVFYKCEKLWQWGDILRFKRTEFQDMKEETVDENENNVISEKWYWGKKRIFDAYDTHYLRGGLEASQKVEFQAYDVKFLTRFAMLFRNCIDKFRRPVEPQKEVKELSTGYAQAVRVAVRTITPVRCKIKIHRVNLVVPRPPETQTT
jgi:hypothetical protein